MTVRVIRAARRSARRVRNRIAPRAVILLYHRIANHQTDPWSLNVTPEHFAQQMAALRALANPVPLQSIVNGLHKRVITASGGCRHIRRRVCRYAPCGQAGARPICDSSDRILAERADRCVQ